MKTQGRRKSGNRILRLTCCLAFSWGEDPYIHLVHNDKRKFWNLWMKNISMRYSIWFLKVEFCFECSQTALLLTAFGGARRQASVALAAYLLIAIVFLGECKQIGSNRTHGVIVPSLWLLLPNFTFYWLNDVNLQKICQATTSIIYFPNPWNMTLNFEIINWRQVGMWTWKRKWEPCEFYAYYKQSDILKTMWILATIIDLWIFDWIRFS